MKALIFPVPVAGKTASISNCDTPGFDPMDFKGESVRDGSGASIAHITP